VKDDGTPVDDRASPRVACAVATARGATPERSILGLHLIEVDGERRVSGPRWRQIADLLEGAEAIFLDPDREAPPLLAALAKRGLSGPDGVRSLASAARGAVRIPRGSTPEEIAHLLGCAWREADTPEDAAANVAACLRAAAALLEKRSASEPAGEPAVIPEALGPWSLASVPERPGVYRFFDAAGKLLYVGKASNLRRRLTSYASASRAGRGAGGARGASGAREKRRILARLGDVHRVEFEVLGSELEALLAEARLIRRRSPETNVQRDVHERGRAYGEGRAQALLLPSAAPGACAVVFVRDGRLEGWARLGSRGGGAAACARILRRLLGARTRALRGEEADRDTEILRTWLAGHAEEVSRVDLDSSLGPADALEKIRHAAREHAESGFHEPVHRR
jgi:hypothetical protein